MTYPEPSYAMQVSLHLQSMTTTNVAFSLGELSSTSDDTVIKFGFF